MKTRKPLPMAPGDWLERSEFLRSFPADDLVQRLCEAEEVDDVLQEMGLRRDELRTILRRSEMPLPTSLSDFHRYRREIFENIGRYQSHLKQTAKLRSALKVAKDELLGTYSLPWSK